MTTTARCPACRSKMVPHKVRDVALDRCPLCGGIWFDAGELDAAVNGNIPFSVTQELSKRCCPRCETAMPVTFIGDVHVERCRNCRGLFLDAGEFEKVRGRHGRSERDPVQLPLDGPEPYRPSTGHSILAEAGVEVVIEIIASFIFD